MDTKEKTYIQKLTPVLTIGRDMLIIAWGLLVFGFSGYSLYLYAFDTAKATELPPASSAHTIVLTEEGFEPRELTVKEGDTVTFSTTGEDAFWPASNLHPSHTIYPDFDPKTVIFPEDSWSFTFTQVGEWKYHDHLNPIYTGVVYVIDKDATAFTASTESDCKTLQGPEKIQCFDTKLESVLVEDGMEAAFEYFLGIYNEDPEVPSVCHGWAHRLGEVEYGLYKEGKEVTLRPEATFCSYGYFHGFINAMVEDTQSVYSALTFCEEAVVKNGEELKGMRNNCIHGIGHSISTLLLEDPANWGGIQKITNRGFSTCEDLYAERADQSICYDGMFHELHLSILNDQYGFNSQEFLQSGDLFFYCRDLDEQYKESCYFDFITLWPYFFGEDKKASMEYALANIDNPENNALRPFHTFGRSFIEADITTGEYQESAEACRLAPEYLWGECMAGLAAGFIEHGEPENMHEEGIRFCRSDYLTAPEHAECMKRLINLLSFQYTEERLLEVCAELTKEEQDGACENI